MLKIKPLVAVVGTSLLMVGCGEVKEPEPQDTWAADMLAQSAREVTQRNLISDQLLTKRYDIQPSSPLPKPDEVPLGLNKLLSMQGGQQFELSVFVRHMAREGGIVYLESEGLKPMVPITVLFANDHKSVLQFIADAGTQAGYRADVVLDLSAKPVSVQIKYLDAM